MRKILRFIFANTGDIFFKIFSEFIRNRILRAADWKLDQPDWTGRMRLIALGKLLELRLEDKSSGELFAKCPIDGHPGIAIEPVIDSSRYFVIRLKNDNGQTAFVGKFINIIHKVIISDY